MFNSELLKLTKYAKIFLEPSNSTHRQYEALRAYFVEGLPSKEAASCFGYTPGSFRLLCHQFRQNPDRQFFLPPPKGPQSSPKKDHARDQVIAMRKLNLSVYDIKRCLEEAGTSLSTVSISIILKEEGFARLPRRRDDERPNKVRPDTADVADVRKLQLEVRRFRTQFGGIFLFLPYLVRIPLDEILQEADFPGSKMIPAAHAMRSLLALKLFGNARHSHVMSFVFDEGLPLFAGLNAIPKRSFLTEYSCRIHPPSYPKVMQLWFDAVGKLGIERGVSFDLDFHTIPFHGEDALVEKHYVSKRSRRQKGILAFLARDADKNIFCYANAQLRKEQQNDEILRFIEFWEKRTGRFPNELIFDSKLTTYSNLNRLNQRGIKFITLRRRSKKMLEDIYRTQVSAWRTIVLDNIARAYRTPRVLDQKVSLDEYEGFIRQLTIMNLGHEEPTVLITNQLDRPASKLLGRYAKRMIIENAIADGIDFFHMDALSSAVAMKVDCDLQLTLMASSLYRLFGSQIGNGYNTAKSRHIFRDFINATAQISIEKENIFVRFQKRAHNPLLKAAGFEEIKTPIPWLGNKTLRFIFG
jgi:hypothetical protein